MTWCMKEKHTNVFSCCIFKGFDFYLLGLVWNPIQNLLEVKTYQPWIFPRPLQPSKWSPLDSRSVNFTVFHVMFIGQNKGLRWWSPEIREPWWEHVFFHISKIVCFYICAHQKIPNTMGYPHGCLFRPPYRPKCQNYQKLCKIYYKYFIIYIVQL